MDIGDYLVAQLLFALLMLLMGAVAVFYPKTVRNAAIKLHTKVHTGADVTKLGTSRQLVPSIRFGGAIAVFIGGLLLWALWRQQ